ncbi:MAG TPA: hypothetical protein VLI67_01055 [Vicinamibacteria bacterium]|nr:hypothetical protein [Vicinamibacteria bacterium]
MNRRVTGVRAAVIAVWLLAASSASGQSFDLTGLRQDEHGTVYTVR